MSENGYEVLRGKNLKSFLDAARNSGKDINLPTKTIVLGVFDFRAFLNMAMFLSESEKARALRQLGKAWDDLTSFFLDYVEIFYL